MTGFHGGGEGAGHPQHPSAKNVHTLTGTNVHQRNARGGWEATIGRRSHASPAPSPPHPTPRAGLARAKAPLREIPCGFGLPKARAFYGVAKRPFFKAAEKRANCPNTVPGN